MAEIVISGKNDFFDISFTLRSRINLLVGESGTYKSYMISAIAEMLGNWELSIRYREDSNSMNEVVKYDVGIFDSNIPPKECYYEGKYLLIIDDLNYNLYKSFVEGILEKNDDVMFLIALRDEGKEYFLGYQKEVYRVDYKIVGDMDMFRLSRVLSEDKGVI